MGPPWFRRLATGVAVVVGCVSVLAFVAAPHHAHHGVIGNETAALATLRNLCSAQQQFRERGLADADADGKGEYGLFGELSGACFVRGTERPLDPPVLSASFRVVDEQGVVHRSGYCFRIFLPGREGGWVTEHTTPRPVVVAPVPVSEQGCCAGRDLRPVARSEVAVTGPVAPDSAEQRWYAYAWPIDAGRTGNRSFYVDQDGDIYATEERRSSPPSLPLARDGRRWTVMP